MKKLNYTRIARALAYRFPWYARCRCVLCGHSLYRFLPYRNGSFDVPPIISALGAIGSNVVAFECPWCGCHDRERHLFLYMNATGLLSGLSQKEILHFAPEKRLAPIIAAASPKRYLKCDLFPQTHDVIRVDMLEMPFEAESFDLVIANHVMEHVADDIKALREIHRVLKPGGHAILQTPFSSKLHATWSDDGIDTDEARLQVYGQEDHVRLYGRDVFGRFESIGFVSCVKQHRELLPEIDEEVYGINEKEPFFLFLKHA